ncbi:MAG: hypothetical protein HOM55_06460 [Proteobacteria bacterium]|jgi:hypothetical protein|nr:hypothetical protein [Pseudomonadota bacterium]
MRTKHIISLVAGLILLAVGTVSLAHHGRAAYGTEQVSLQATITEFRFVNPHVQIYFDITGEDGELQHWRGEITAPNRLARAGWTKTTLQPGDQVKISGDRARNGGNAVRISELILADGTNMAPWTSGILPQ